MNKNKVFPTIFIVLMLVGLSLLTACQSANPDVVMAAAPEDVAELMKDYGKDVGFRKDYIPHMWDIPKNKEKSVINWFITRNQHLKQRRIDTIEEGIKKLEKELA